MNSPSLIIMFIVTLLFLPLFFVSIIVTTIGTLVIAITAATTT